MPAARGVVAARGEIGTSSLVDTEAASLPSSATASIAPPQEVAAVPSGAALQDSSVVLSPAEAIVAKCSATPQAQDARDTYINGA